MNRRYLKPFALLGFLVIVAGPAASAGAADRGTKEISGSQFDYSVTARGSNDRRIEVTHRGEKYDGPLAKMSFRDRHLQVFEMVARLIKNSCQNGVSALGDIYLSKDPEQDQDPEAAHPQYFIWDYTCK
ncbi:hypothetical protein [Rhizobium sp. CF142]|uniref:hypothetical protein n=1 Tax=Rhizobium sp. CF142 TaxID=1144314 RepID=UPI00026EEF44|nr:hypothetical protein [Rhizobium sp. CF142]EJJ28430.1 hypothetical protein PMI11_03339 [Rhizobium sp. CF142]